MSAAMPSTLACRMRTMRSWLVGSYEMFPVPSCFSKPPIRCSSPAVPGTAQARAIVSGSRRYGQNSSLPSLLMWFGSVAKFGGRSGSASKSGNTQGSEPLAR